MRNKFSELVSQGVASFKPTPLAGAVPQNCPICRTYNNIWGIATNTHASNIDGRPVITGTRVGWDDDWTLLCYTPYIGGYNFKTAGYYSLSEFLYQVELRPNVCTINGQRAIELLPREEECCSDMKCNSYTTSESNIPHPIKDLGNIQECLMSSSLREAARKMNVMPSVVGEHWHVYEDTIVGLVNGKSVILEMSYEKGVKIQNDELQQMLDVEGIGELFLRQFPRYFVVDSNDKKWQALLRKDENNKTFVKSFDELTPQQWFEEIKAIIATYS